MSRKFTFDDFVKKARLVHGDRYDYSKVNYININTKVEIICSVHGSFFQTPTAHLNGQGCPFCNKGSKRLTTSEFIEKAKLARGNNYDYSKVNYINAKTKVEIICPAHGSFYITPDNFLRGHGCPKCGQHVKRPKKAIRDYSDEEFKKEASKIHNNFYDYSQTFCSKSSDILKIICPIHGVFYQRAADHLQGKGCPICGKEKQHIKKYTSENFIELAKENNDKLDFSKTVFIYYNQPVKVICKKCGREFFSMPSNILSGKGCFNCRDTKPILNAEDYLRKFRAKHGNRYGYIFPSNINYHIKMGIVCPEHGIFYLTPSKHISGFGCPTCANRAKSNLAAFVKDYLIANKISFQTEKRFADCADKAALPFDFYLPDLNVCIEVNGAQHYKFVPHFYKDLHAFHRQKHHDWLKRKYCLKNGIKLIVLKYDDNLEEKLEFLKVTLYGRND